MKERVFYDLDKLLKLLPGFSIKKIGTKYEDEDNIVKTEKLYITNKSNISHITSYYCFWSTTTVHFEDMSKVNLYSDNINSSDPTYLRERNNDFLSPAIKINAGMIEMTEDLHTWLINIGIPQDMLDNISMAHKIYDVIEYQGVGTPCKHTGFNGEISWGVSSENLVMSEQEIETVLNGIEDDLLRKKIELILYARVFKKKY